MKGLAAGAGIATLALFVACLEATQVDADLTADSSLCAAGRSLYFIRVRRIVPNQKLPASEDDPLVRQNDGELPACTTADPSTFLGNFTLLPEDETSKDFSQEVQFVINTAGGSPRDCDDFVAGVRRTIPLNCVVVRRRVKFVSHKGVRVPMYLDDRCRGVSCDEDATCFRGTCKPADTTCDDATGVCVPEHERVVQPGGLGFDPTRTAGLPPGVVGFDDAGNVLLSDGKVVQPDGADIPDTSALLDTSIDTSTGDSTVSIDGPVGPDTSTDGPTSDVSVGVDTGADTSTDTGVVPDASSPDASVVK